MRFWVLSLLILFTVSTYAQDEEIVIETDLTFIGDLFADLLTPKTPYERCAEEQEDIRKFLNGAITVLEISNADQAWSYVDHAFMKSLMAISDCSEDKIQMMALDEIFRIINDLDDVIACRYHMVLGGEKFTLAQEAYKKEDMEESEFQIHGAIFSMKEALRFCEKDSEQYKDAQENIEMLETKALTNFD